MTFRISFGLVEIFGIFGCYGLVTSNFVVGSVLMGLALFGSFFRYAIDLQQKKENNEKLEDVTNQIKNVLLTPSAWAGISNKNTAH